MEPWLADLSLADALGRVPDKQDEHAADQRHQQNASHDGSRSRRSDEEDAVPERYHHRDEEQGEDHPRPTGHAKLSIVGVRTRNATQQRSPMTAAIHAHGFTPPVIMSV